jgi:hypothetical protein
LIDRVSISYNNAKQGGSEPMRLSSMTKSLLFVFAFFFSFSTLYAASTTPPEAWNDLPVMYDKGRDNQQNLRWFTDREQNKVFTFGMLQEQIKTEADGHYDWVPSKANDTYRLKTVFLRKLNLKGDTKLSSVELIFRSCRNEKKARDGVELVEIYNPESDKTITGRAVKGLLYPWFKRYF